MYAHELFEQNKPRVVVTYPGRFQPFHQGHAGVFARLQKEFGAENVYIATSNDQSSAKSPFNFSDKYQLMTAAGVPAGKIIQTNAMYALPEGVDPANTIFITAVGAPDADRLNPDSVLKRDKKDKQGNVIKPAGSPGYYKIWNPKGDPLTADQHGYVIVIPEIKKSIKIKDQTYDVSHGTEARNLWNMVRDDEAARAEFLSQLYGKSRQDLGSIFDKIPQTTSEDIVADNGDSASPISGGQVYEQGVAESNDDDVWGPQGNFAGDKSVDLGGSVSKKLDVDDTVTYFGEKATILAMSKDRTVSRIHLKSGITQNVKTSDLKRVGQDVAEDQLNEACWKGYHKEGMKTMFGKRYPNCVKNKNESLETYINKGECPGCGGAMISESELTEKQDACYHKVKSRYKVWPSAYASGALVQCRKKGAANWGNKSESITQEEYDQLDENLKKWFSDKWVRFGPDGKIRGDCARGDSSEGKPKCLPQSKAHALGKKGRASAAARKRRQDPNPERKGAAINVATKKKTNEGASGVIATKKQAKDPRYSMSLTKDVRPGQIEKSLRALRLAEQADSNNQMFDLFAKFLPLAMKDLGLTTLPKIIPELHIESHDGQATFGRFVNDEMSIHLALANRHPVDILRTLAHELVHFKQLTMGKINDASGETGSPEENQANTIAGIIMRHFNKEYPDAVNMQPIQLDESLVTVNYGIGKNPGKLVKVGAGGRVPHAKLHVNVDKKTARKLGVPHVNENFADGRNPGDKGSLKAKVKGKVTMAKARAILKNKNSTPRAKQLAHWFINMNKGRNK